MKKKIGIFVGGIVLAIVMIMAVRYKMGIRPIKSALVEHEKLVIEVLTKNIESQDEYKPLTRDSIISGEIEVIGGLLPDDNHYAYVEYKINGFNYAPAYAPSYGVTIDTESLPDGWNQLLVIGYKDSNQIEGVKQIIFKVDNNKVIEPRAARLEKIYTLGESPVYKRDYIPVLMYHDFQKEVTKEQESAVVRPDLFEEQLKILLENGYTPINFKDLDLYMKGKAGLPLKPVIITADDGYLSNYEIAFPLLKKYKIPATFFITTRYVGVDTGLSHFNWEQAKEMEESGLIDIQSHTHGHQLLNTIPDDEMRHQVGLSFGLIEQNLGKRDVKVLAYPQFYNNKHTREILAQEGVDLQITRLGKRFNPSTKSSNIQRIHVTNNTSPEDLLREIKKLTQ